MELISYQDFSKLKIRDFFPVGTQLFLDETGSTECAIGPAATEGLTFTYFAWRSDEPHATAEIALDFREECPPVVGMKILEAIKLPIAPGMSLTDLERVLGNPEFSNLSGEGQGFVRFLCGNEWPYFVGCDVIPGQGVIGVIIFRKDYWQPPE